MQSWMLTIPIRSEKRIQTTPTIFMRGLDLDPVPRICSKKLLNLILEKADVKKWIIAKEKGKNGLDHWQIRLTSSDPEFFEHMSEWCEWAHVEKAQTEDFTYERKEGRYWTSDDTTEIRKCRFGRLREDQQRIIQDLLVQGDRSIDVFYDPVGNRGKSWLSVHLFETGQGLIVPRYSCTPEKLSAFICSAYRGEPFIIIDIPRASKPSTALYETMEEIKDGLVFDPRYSGRTRDIRGVKLAVFTNHKLKLENLSDDRWNLHGWNKDGTLS